MMTRLATRPKQQAVQRKMLHFYFAPWLWNPNWMGGRGCWHGLRGAKCLDFRNLFQQAMREKAEGWGLFVLPARLTDESGVDYLGGSDGVLSIAERITWRDRFGLLRAPAEGTLRQVVWEVFTQLCDPTGESSPCPLLPGADAVLRIVTPGLEKAKRIRPGSLEWRPAVHKYREIYRAIRENERPGKHRQYLSVLLEQFGLPYDAYRQFIPSNLPDETPLPHQTTRIDLFDRASAASLGTSGEGWTWTEIDGIGHKIVDSVSDGVAQIGTGVGSYLAISRANGELSTTNHYSQYTGGVNSQTDVSYSVAIARKDGTATETYMQTVLGYQEDTVYLQKVIGSASTTLDTTAMTLDHATYYLNRLECNGSSHSDSVNSVAKNSATDGAVTSGLRGGIVSFMAEVGAYTEYDSFEMGDLGGSAHTKDLTGTLSLSAALTKLDAKALSGSLSLSGALTKLPAKALTGALSLSGAITKSCLQGLAGALDLAGALTKQGQKALTGSLSLSGSLLKSTAKALAATLSLSGSLAKMAAKALSGAITFTADFAKVVLGFVAHIAALTGIWVGGAQQGGIRPGGGERASGHIGGGEEGAIDET